MTDECCKIKNDIVFGLYVSSPLKDMARPFGEQTRLFEDLSKLGKEQKVTVVVMVPGFCREQVGYQYDTKRLQWSRTSVSMPDIILRRSGTFKQIEKVSVTQDLQLFTRLNLLHTLPWDVSNKWALYQLLSKVTEVMPCLPKSILATRASQVYERAMKMGDVYVKPLAGAQGIGVFHLFTARGNLRVAWEKKKEPRNLGKSTPPPGFLRPTTDVIQREFSNQAAFSEFWSGRRFQRCLVQETVVLPRTLDNRPFDFRWLVQNCKEYQVVARVARIGKPHSVTTNIHTGGDALAAELVIQEAYGSKATDILMRLDQVALDVANALDKRYGHFAEVGVDLALASEEDVKVFEVNPTPGRRMLRSISKDVRELSLRCLLEYAIKAVEGKGDS